MMLPSKNQTAKPFIATVIFSGIVVAILSVLESHVPWVAAFCGFWGDGCKDIETYCLLGFPIAPWGMIYYAVLGLLYLRCRALLFPAIMAGVGFELELMRIMLEDEFLCVFCALNCLLVLILTVCAFDRKRSWEMAAIILLSFTVAGFLVSDGPPREQASGAPRVLAIVGGQEITSTEVEQQLSTLLHKERQKIYEMKKSVLDTRINDLLLEQNADALGLSFDALVSKIRGQITPPADHVVNHYYEDRLYTMWGDFTGSEQEIKKQIHDYVHNRDTNPLLLEYCEKLRREYPVKVFLKAPPLPATQLRIDGAPALGPDNALVTVVELSDYHCPSCRKGHEVVQQIKKKYADRIRWVFKDYPLKKHPLARQLALAASCAHEQEKFWEYQDLLFSGDTKPGLETALAHAKQLGLDMVRFKKDLSDPRLEEKLETTIAEIRAAGISSTPTFIINGKMQTGTPSLEAFSELIDTALQEAATKVELK